MKTKKSGIILIGLLITFVTLGAATASEFDPIGKWKFSAPDAPYPYGTGMFEVKIDGEDFGVTLSMPDVEYKLHGESVKFEDSVLSFNLFIDGVDVFLSMKFIDKDKLSGRAVYFEGAISLTANRDKE
ncbi:MAG: hypothetical protein K8R35_01940 [Bacteroidales bacterium]|nr:hypothetical protein [Bacteroidales bacterium]